MSLTWGTLKAQIARRLNDADHRTYSEALLRDLVNDALVAFAASHTGMASTFSIEGDGETYEFDLPDNLVDEEGAGVYAVYWKEGQWLSRLEYFPGQDWPSTSRTTSSSPVGYVLWPQDKISFTRVPTDGQDITVYYVAYYPEAENDNSTILVPRWAREAIKYYVLAGALEPGSTKAGKLRQYQSRRDAGDPEDNPLLRLAQYYKQRYYEILAAHPAPQYAKLPPAE